MHGTTNLNFFPIGCRIPPKLQLLVTLRYYATGDLQLTVADCSYISQPSVSICVQNVTYAICQLSAEYIKFPSPAEEDDMMRKFQEVTRMPGVIGCIDGSLIPIRSPGGPDAELYRGRKGFFALNVMAVCDPHMIITNLVVNWPGSAHDSRIFRESGLCAALEREEYRGVLLGDKGYACTSYLFTPLREPNTAKERRYNSVHAKTRNLIERTFGIWKRRFGVLNKCLRTKLPTAKRIITACAILHNIARLNNIPLEGEDELQFEENANENNEGGNDVGPRGARRAQYIERHF